MFRCTMIIVLMMMMLVSCKKSNAPDGAEAPKDAAVQQGATDTQDPNAVQGDLPTDRESFADVQGQARWNMLRDYIVRRKNFSVFPSTNLKFDADGSYLRSDGENLEGRKEQWSLDPVNGSFSFDRNYRGDPVYRSFIFINCEEGAAPSGCTVVFYRDNTFSRKKCYSEENAGCGIDEKYFIIF